MVWMNIGNIRELPEMFSLPPGCRWLDCASGSMGKVVRPSTSALHPLFTHPPPGRRKGTDIDGFPGLEDTGIGKYDPTVLNKMDEFMVEAHKYGIKLMISMHSFNSLSAGDAYGKI